MRIQADDFMALDVSRYEVRLRDCAPASLPPFLGSTLRGAFGHALKAAVCVMSHRRCAVCLVADRCIYPMLFETPAPPDLPQLRGQSRAPHLFILSPPIMSAAGPCRNEPRRLAAGDELTFGLLLMGRSIEHLPYVIYAMSEMARGGLDAERVRIALSEVAAVDGEGRRRTIYDGATERLRVEGPAEIRLSELVSRRLGRGARGAGEGARLRLRFETPTRVRVGGDLQARMSFHLLVRNLLRRVSLLAAVHGRGRLGLDYRGLIERAAGVETRRSALRWVDGERYSSRQQTKMALGGFVGEVEYAAEAVGDFLPLIAAGEVLHVGSGTSFGLGRFEMMSW